MVASPRTVRRPSLRTPLHVIVVAISGLLPRDTKRQKNVIEVYKIVTTRELTAVVDQRRQADDGVGYASPIVSLYTANCHKRGGQAIPSGPRLAD